MKKSRTYRLDTENIAFIDWLDEEKGIDKSFTVNAAIGELRKKSIEYENYLKNKGKKVTP
jgi:hypothetical protein